MSRKVLPMLPWELVDELREKVELDVVKQKVSKLKTEDDTGAGDSDEF